jgi:hypothetical protein
MITEAIGVLSDALDEADIRSERVIKIYDPDHLIERTLRMQFTKELLVHHRDNVQGVEIHGVRVTFFHEL